MAFTLPGLTMVTLALFYDVYALADGVTAFFVRGSARRARGRWLTGVAGVIVGMCTFIFGTLVASPAARAPAVVWIIGAYAFIFGLMMIVLAFRLHGLQWPLEKFA
jgi:uncharacterized membrane protein HdeD (DUF308 family)